MKRLITVVCLLVVFQIVFAQGSESSLAFIHRVIPDRAASFVVEKLSATESPDVFGIESRNDKIVLRGNNGVAVASALYYYLTHFCHCQITWNGTNLNIPKVLPRVDKKVHETSPYSYRYYMNYCTFNYSMSWWDWKRWEKEIDWMALRQRGIGTAWDRERAGYKVRKG